MLCVYLGVREDAVLGELFWVSTLVQGLVEVVAHDLALQRLGRRREGRRHLDLRVCVPVRVCVRLRVDVFVCSCVYVGVYVRVRVCVCVCVHMYVCEAGVG